MGISVMEYCYFNMLFNFIYCFIETLYINIHKGDYYVVFVFVISLNLVSSL